jgi:uncharacterized protein YdeI (YjbR/CyaY-like superfamily)
MNFAKAGPPVLSAPQIKPHNIRRLCCQSGIKAEEFSKAIKHCPPKAFMDVMICRNFSETLSMSFHNNGTS